MTIKLMPMMTPTPNANARNQPTIGGTLFAVLFMTFLTARGRENLIIGTALFCIGPLILFLFMGNLRGILYSAGVGFTILLGCWCSLIKHVAPKESSKEQSNPSWKYIGVPND
jgi:hypothetical protein